MKSQRVFCFGRLWRKVEIASKKRADWFGDRADFSTGDVLMLGFMNDVGLRKRGDGEVVFFSGAEQALEKGRVERALLRVRELRIDCDAMRSWREWTGWARSLP